MKNKNVIRAWFDSDQEQILLFDRFGNQLSDIECTINSHVDQGTTVTAKFRCEIVKEKPQKDFSVQIKEGDLVISCATKFGTSETIVR